MADNETRAGARAWLAEGKKTRKEMANKRPFCPRNDEKAAE